MLLGLLGRAGRDGRASPVSRLAGSGGKVRHAALVHEGLASLILLLELTIVELAGGAGWGGPASALGWLALASREVLDYHTSSRLKKRARARLRTVEKAIRLIPEIIPDAVPL